MINPCHIWVEVICKLICCVVVERMLGLEPLWSEQDDSRYLVLEKMMGVLACGSC